MWIKVIGIERFVDASIRDHESSSNEIDEETIESSGVEVVTNEVFGQFLSKRKGFFDVVVTGRNQRVISRCIRGARNLNTTNAKIILSFLEDEAL